MFVVSPFGNINVEFLSTHQNYPRHAVSGSVTSPKCSRFTVAKYSIAQKGAAVKGFRVLNIGSSHCNLIIGDWSCANFAKSVIGMIVNSNSNGAV